MCEWNRNIIIQDIVLAIVINTSATLLGGDPFDHTWYTFTCVALATNVLGQFLLPTGTWARALTGWAGEASWRVYVQIFIENLIFVTIISLGAHRRRRSRCRMARHLRLPGPHWLRDLRGAHLRPEAQGVGPRVARIGYHWASLT